MVGATTITLHFRKKAGAGRDRAASVGVVKLKAGFDKLKSLHGECFLPMLVPPWNRIDRPC